MARRSTDTPSMFLPSTSLWSALQITFILMNILSQLSGSCASSVPTREDWYPRYHLSPPSGWMNDPNGLIYHDGYYHFFYQHNPDEPRAVMNKLSWGHARSKNMLDWEHLPVALFSATIEEDKDGCFSGSAVIHDGEMTLIYTGNRMINGQMYQVQCLATSNDTINFTKKGKVLEPPAGIIHFRDPKVWKEDGLYHMVVGMGIDEKGLARLYTSTNLTDWKDEGTLVQVENLGYVWECPDLFKLGEKHLLMFSPQGVQKHKGFDNVNLFQTGYLMGTWKSGEKFTLEQGFQEIDFGHDFYAPQSFLAADGRRISAAWMDMWETPMPERDQNWAGMFSLPRELTLTSDHKVRSRPIREVETLRKDKVKLSPTTFSGDNKSEYLRVADDVKSMEIILKWDQNASNAERYGLVLGDAAHRDGGVFLFVDNQARRLILDRRYTHYGVSGYRSIPLKNEDPLTMRVFFDGSSIEVFINDGEYTMSSRIYPSKEQRVLSLFAENGPAVLLEGSHWRLG